MAQRRYCKTNAGRQEIEQRSRKLAANVRSILVMVDGRREEQELLSLISSLHAPADTLQQLAGMGLIEELGNAEQPLIVTEHVVAAVSTAAAERYNALYARVSESIRMHLGLKGYFLQLKVERCADVAELEGLLPDVAVALAKAKGEPFAQGWLTEVRRIGIG